MNKTLRMVIHSIEAYIIYAMNGDTKDGDPRRCEDAANCRNGFEMGKEKR